MLFILDTYAWVEYFTGSVEGEKVSKLFAEENNNFITVECCLAELKGWCIKNKINFEDVLRIVETNSDIVPVLKKDWIDAASVKSTMRKTLNDFGLIDAILLAKQKYLKCKIVTADKHFKNLKDIEFLK